MKRPSKQWTRDERQSLVLRLALKIKAEVALVRKGERDPFMFAGMAFTWASIQKDLLTGLRHALEANREEIERVCGV